MNNIKSKIKNNTKLIIITAASNVVGRKLPLKRIGEICKNYGILFCVDAAQLAGKCEINIKNNNIDFAVVAPDDPLVLGAVDLLEAKGIPCFGPNKNAAIIEGSKIFSKNLMKKYGIPTANYETFSDMESAIKYLELAEKYDPSMPHFKKLLR